MFSAMDDAIGLIGLVVFIGSVLVSPIEGHLCIISPHQRGPLDVSQSGSPTCTRHGAPCGGMPVEPPRVVYSGGSTIFVKFQQNYNHYEVGYPGYMDIAIANSSSPDAHFSIVGVFGDVNEHAQDNQQNYTLPLVLPDIDCAHCVLRGRYVSHKPGEQVFYQCSDIVIRSSKTVKSSAAELNLRGRHTPPNGEGVRHQLSKPLVGSPPIKTRSAGVLLYGFAWTEEKSGSVFVTVDTATGVKQKISPMFFSVGSGIQYGTPSPMAQSNKYIMDQIACYGREMPYLNLIEHRNGGLDAASNKLLWIDMVTREIAGEYELDTPEHLPIVSLVPYLKQVYLTVQIKEITSHPGTFFLRYGTLTYTGKFEAIYNTSMAPEQYYVNYLWATANYQTKMHYLLMGHENTPDKLKAKIYSFDAPKRLLVSAIEVDVSEYTIAAIQVYEKTGQLFAMSPGLFGDPYPAWNLVTVNASNGSIKKIYQVAPAGIFEQYYGGNVINIDQDNGVLFYVLRVAGTQNDVIASVSLDTGKVHFSLLTNLKNIHNLAFYKN